MAAPIQAQPLEAFLNDMAAAATPLIELFATYLADRVVARLPEEVLGRSSVNDIDFSAMSKQMDELDERIKATEAQIQQINESLAATDGVYASSD